MVEIGRQQVRAVPGFKKLELTVTNYIFQDAQICRFGNKLYFSNGEIWFFIFEVFRGGGGGGGWGGRGGGGGGGGGGGVGGGGGGGGGARRRGGRHNAVTNFIL